MGQSFYVLVFFHSLIVAADIVIGNQAAITDNSFAMKNVHNTTLMQSDYFYNHNLFLFVFAHD